MKLVIHDDDGNVVATHDGVTAGDLRKASFLRTLERQLGGKRPARTVGSAPTAPRPTRGTKGEVS